MDYHSDDSSDPDTPEAFKSGSGKRVDSLRAVDVMAILHEKVAFLSGGRDPRGGPLLTFPACERREKLKHTDYRPLLHYLTRIPCEDVQELGFTVIVDMRGSTWGTVKHVLKELHLTFAHTVHIVYIIKPDNFWQKQRTSIGSQKYKFETSLMSVGTLCKSVDPSQLTTDFDGTLPYDHNTWIELRLAIEEFTACTNNTLDQLESLRQEVNCSEFAEDVVGAKAAVEKHKQLQARLSSPSINELHAMGHRLLQRLQCDEGGERGGGGGTTGYDSGYSGRDSSASLILSNPDLQNCIPTIARSLSSVEACVAHVQQSWQSKKLKLEQCLQLRMLEQDVEKMFDWLYHNREEFLVSYVEIGHTCHIAKHLQETHSQFTIACQKVYLNLNKILSVASHLIESGHYAAQHIASLASKLDQVWKEFAAGLDERSSVLALSVMFHQKAEQYIDSVSGWIESCNVPGLSNDIRSLETNIHLHQQLYETMCQAYTEVHSTSKKLLYQLDHLVQICSQLRRDTPLRSKHKKPRGKPSAYSVTPDGKVVYRGNQQQQSSGSGGSTGAGSGGNSSSAASTPSQGAGAKGAKGPTGSSPASDYSEGASHVLAVIHEILAHHRAVEQRWTAKKLKLHQRLALRLFQEDVKQVIDWIATHGEVFLHKNPGVGRNLSKARMYQKSHEHFEMVAENTYTNAEKLLQAAEELAHTGECNPQEIYNVAQQLNSHITSFVSRVNQRRRLLQLAVMFFTHQGELVSWLQEVVADAANDDVRGLTTIESAEEALAALQQQQETTEDACASTDLEGKSLLRELRSMGVTKESGCGSIEGIEEALDGLAKEQTAIQTVWTARRIKLDLLLQLRLFQRDALQVLESVDEWSRDASTAEGLDGVDRCEAEQLLMIHNENIAGVTQEAVNALRRGHEIMQLLKTSGLELECYSSGEEEAGEDSSGGGSISGSAAVTTTGGTGGNNTPTNSGGEESSGGSGVGSVTSVVSSSRHSMCSSGGTVAGSVSATRSSNTALSTATTTGGEKVSTLVDLLHSAHVRLESIAQEKQGKLEQVIHLCHFLEQAQQVLRWIHSGEAMLSASYSIPNSLVEAQAMSQDHQQFQVAIEKTHASVVQLRERSAQLHHCNSQQLIDMQNTVAKRWENLVTCAEDRYKLVQASISFYKTAEQVCSVLESLERDYRRDDDWCQKDMPVGADGSVAASGMDKASTLRLKIEKHQEQKESFLRACTLARKTAQTFLKYANRSQMYYRVEEGMWVPENKVRAILDDLMVKENNVLECWTEKKRTLDQCAQYITLENNAKLALDWITQTGEKYLESHTSLGDTREETEQLLKEHTKFKVTAKDTRENVKMILQLADKLVENGHKHAAAIRECVTRVDKAYKNFSARMDTYRIQLEGRLGICSEESKTSLSLDRHSDPTLEHKMQTAAANVAKSEMSEEKRRSARKKELIMKELLETERTYVKDLEICVSCYLYETRQQTAPKALQGKEHIIFCNMEEILNFHKNTFLQVLEKYKAMPEDAGHCFVTFAPKFDIYVTYCKAQPESNKLLVNHAGNFYEEVQRRHNIEHPIPAYLIKPVQRITKYQLLLRELLACCEEDNPGEIREGLEVMQNVPKKANDVLHLSMLEGCDIPIDKLGDVILQDSFQVWDPRQLLRKHRERHVFLFEHHVVFCKETKDQSNAGSSSGVGSQGGSTNKYQYKQRLVTSELGLSEHIDGDECKLALWVGARSGAHDSKMILRASSVETKQAWVKKLRQVIQDSYLSNHLAKAATTTSVSTSTTVSTTKTTSSTASASKTPAIVSSSSSSTGASKQQQPIVVGEPRSVVGATTSVIAATAHAGITAAARQQALTRSPLHTSLLSNNHASGRYMGGDSEAIGGADADCMSYNRDDRISLASFTSTNTEGSDRGIPGVLDYGWVIDDYTATSPGELSISKGQYVEVLEHPHSSSSAANVQQQHTFLTPSIASSCSASSSISSKSTSSSSNASSRSLSSASDNQSSKSSAISTSTASSMTSSSGVSSLCSSSSLFHSLSPRDPGEWAFVRMTISSQVPEAAAGHGGGVVRSYSGLSKVSNDGSSCGGGDDVSADDVGQPNRVGSAAMVTHHVIEEGYVPLSALRLARSGGDISDNSGSVDSSQSSSVAKRKPFNSRKWLPPQLRKLSQPGRSSSNTSAAVGSSSSAAVQSGVLPSGSSSSGSNATYHHHQLGATPSPPSAAVASRHHLSKVGGVGREMGNKVGSAGQALHSGLLHSATGVDAEEGDLEVELPPPMRVMEEPLSAAAASQDAPPASSSCAATAAAASVTPGAGGSPHVLGALVAAAHNTRSSCASLSGASTEPSTAHLAYEIENIVKEKMEQHEGNSLDGVLKATSPPLDDGLMSPPSSATSPPHSSHHFSYSGGDGSQHSNSPDEPGVHKEQQAAVERKLRYVVNELVETEINYVRDLADVVDGYLVEMYSVDHKMPEELQNGKDKIVFGNIAAIYEWHRDYFSKNLEECRSSPEKIGSVFIKSEKKFQMYIKYCQNKPKSEYIVSEFYDYFEDIKNKLGHKLALSDILIKPIQRLTKYQLLLKDLVKYTERAGHIEQLCTLEKALYVMTVIPRDADHMMTVGRLQDFEGNIMAQGKLLHYGPLLVSEGDSSAPFRPKVLVAFLFEQRIIFAECHKKKNQYSSDEYICKNHLQMNKLALEERCDPLDTTKFLLKSTDPRKLDLSFVCQGEDQATHHTWTSQIRRLLQTQKDFLLAIQSPIAYQKEQTKHLIDAASAWDPIVLRGEKLSTDITIESLAPVPRLPLETLLPLPPQPLDTLDDVPITVVDVSSPLGAGTSTAAQFTQASRQRDTSTVVSSNQSTVTSTAGSASDSSLWSEAPVSPSSPPMVQHRWSAGECSTGGHPSSTSHSTFYQPSPPPNFYNTNSSPAHHSGGGVFQSFSFSGGSGSGSSPPRNRRTTLFEGFKSTLRPRSKLEGGSGGLHTEAVVMQDCRGGSVSLMAGTLVQTLQPYTAIKEDEITVVRGEEVQVVSSSTRGYLIHRAATSSSPAAEGWVPAYVIQPPTPSPVSPYPPSHPSFSSSTSSSRTSPLTSKSSSPSNPFPPNSGFPSPPPPPSHVVQSQHYSKKSWIKFRKPSFSKREAKAAAQRREADMAGGCSNDAGRLLGVSAYGTTGAESSERSLGGDRNSAGSGSFGAADLYSVSNSSDISISDRLSIGGSAASDTYCHHSSTNLSSSNRSNAFIEDDTSDCVIVGEGGDELLQLVSPLSNLSIPPGQPFTLSLAVSGSGADSAIVSWFGPSGELDNDTRYELQHLRDGTIALHLGSCSAGDTGRYTCVVTSVGATATRQLRCSANVAFL